MADWSDIIGMDLKAARERAAKYDHDVEVMMIQEEGKEVRPGEKDPERTRPAVLVTVDGVGEDAKVLAEHRTVEAPVQATERVPFEEVAPQLPEMTGDRIRAAQEVIDAAALQTSKSAVGHDSDAAAAVFVAGNAVGEEAAASPGYAMAVARALDDDFGKGTSPHAVATSIAADMALQNHAARLLAGGSEMTDDQKAQWTSVAEGRYDGLSEGLRGFVFDNIKDEVFVSGETETMLENFLGEEASKNESAEIEDDEYRPRFGSQFGRDEEELEDEGRPAGFTFNPVEEPSLASKNEHDAALVGADLRSVLNDPDLPEVFEGKTITVTLGFGERYVFDGDRIHNSLANGEWSVPGGFPENVFVAREGDPMKDPKHAWKVREQQLEYGIRAVAALSAQANTEIDHRTMTGGLEPTPACEHLEAFYGEGRAAIVAERMDTLSNADLEALSQMNLKKLSQAAIDMLVEARHTEGPAEEVRLDREKLSPHISTSVKEGGLKEGALSEPSETSVTAGPRSNNKAEHEIDLAAGLKAVSQSPMTAVEIVRSKGIEDMEPATLVHAMTRGGAER